MTEPQHSYFSTQDYFNSHAHVERDQRRRYAPRKPANFNSHAHVERDIKSGTIEYTLEISTHTLTWSVTGKFGGEIQLRDHFNSHAHVERDT